ncbi:MAG: DUF547 domain-containing protein [Gammaproteobacteria bacterium]|nr:DUF547 domain-containing protein [Gammaproteobacteria bacterium]MDH5617397.1 DUF547 domain-containing protein [Gammaproteobacteria bacterium]
MRMLIAIVAVCCGLLGAPNTAHAADGVVPEPFRGFDPDSRKRITYENLDTLLGAVVADMGRSTREKAAPDHARTGTRMKTKVNPATVNEGNRFYFETFVDNEAAQATLRSIQEVLEQLPAQVPLASLNRDEQLAYWLNLYNVTVLNEIVAIYPRQDLKRILEGKKSILAKKSLNVAGVPLSLDDIQFTILRQNYDNNPLIIYGLYQGNIGGPNIRTRAYSGKDVYAALTENAIEFINSNRGTAARNAQNFRVSSFYDRNRAYFPNFEADLTAHLLKYLEGDERAALQAASTLKPDISDWTVTDLGGSRREIGGSLALNNAALMGSMSGSNAADSGGALGSSGGSAAGNLSPALARQMKEREAGQEENEDEDADEVPAEPGPTTEQN